MSRSRIIVAVWVILWMAHVGVCTSLGTRSPGPVLSDLLQLVIGGFLIAAMVMAAKRSEGMARAFWRLATGAYALWMIAQSLGVYNDLARTPVVSWLTNLLFCFWFAPLAMALFLNPEHETGRIDAILVLDFVQGMLVCISAYIYFFYLPSRNRPAKWRMKSGPLTSADMRWSLSPSYCDPFSLIRGTSVSCSDRWDYFYRCRAAWTQCTTTVPART